MTRLPVITGFGGINAAGRSSAHQSYHRMVIDTLSAEQALQTRASLAALTGRLQREQSQWQNGLGEAVEFEAYLAQIAGSIDSTTLIRKLEKNLFDPANLTFHRPARFDTTDSGSMQFQLHKKHLPTPLPQGWAITEDPDCDGNTVTVVASENFRVLMECSRQSTVNSAGQLPSGFEPASLYASRNHPRGLQMTVFGASDAINSLGIDWDTIRQRIPPDQISVYAGSCSGQLDYNGFGGMMKARLLGKKVTSKQLPLGYAEMPADFINAYLLGNLGTTGTNVATCATFLYNLRQGIRDIQSGTHRVVIVGASEAPLVAEVFDGFSTMGALADDASLRVLDNLDESTAPDFNRACRPFGFNAGFTLAESAQFVVLFDDELALELGATIYGSVNEVFINADGYKKSIASPGLGNYISMAKAAAATRNIIGDEGLKQRSYVQAHGTGTLQNRLTESHIINQIAESFSISQWPVAAIKSYVGHSLAASGGDQLMASLGVWSHGVIPGILTVDEIADDVHHDKLDILLQHKEIGAEGMDAVIINSKGFGGNNASGSILAPHITHAMLLKRYGAKAMNAYRSANEAVLEKTQSYDESMIEGKNSIIYKFNHNVLDGEAFSVDEQGIGIEGIEPKISLQIKNSYSDMCD